MTDSALSRRVGGSRQDRLSRLASTQTASTSERGGQFLESSIDLRGLSNIGRIPNEIVVGTMLNVEREVINASPVDTGRFVASWIATQGAASTEDPISKKQQSLYRSQGRTFVRKVAYTGLSAWRKVSAGVTLFLVNNVSYGNILRQGGSPYSVKPGWLEGAVRRGIRRRSRSVKRT